MHHSHREKFPPLMQGIHGQPPLVITEVEKVIGVMRKNLNKKK
jgi:hypothetical protein